MDWVVQVDDGRGTQPFTTTMEENVGPNAEIIGWYTSTSESADLTLSPVMGSTSDFNVTTYSNLSTTNAYVREVTDNTGTNIKNPGWGESNISSNTNGNFRAHRHIIVRYHRASVIASGGTVTNTLSATKTAVDGEVKNVTTSGSYEYESVKLDIGNGIQVTKRINDGNTSWDNRYITGGINILESNQDIDSSIVANYPFTIGVTSTGLALSGITENNIYDYMVDEDINGETVKVVKAPNTYQTVLTDNTLRYNGSWTGFKQLTKDDYAFTSFYMLSIVEYDATIDPDYGIMYQERGDYSNSTPVDVYVQVNGNTEWIKIGTVENHDDGFLWTDGDGSTKMVSENDAVLLPENTTGIEFRHSGNQARLHLKANVNTTFYASDETKAFVADKNTAVIANNDEGAIYSSDGIKIAEGSQHQAKEFTRLNPQSKMYKEEVYNSKSSDATAQEERQSFAVTQYDYVDLGTTITVEDALNMDLITIHNQGVFYDLLPKGSSVNLDSIQVYRVQAYNDWNVNHVADTSQEVDYTLEFIDNWQNSGRTMMIVRAMTTDNYYVDGTRLVSGLQLRYQMIYPWQSVFDFGGTMTNSVGYQSLDGNLANGRSDDGGQIQDSNKMTDLDQNGANASDDASFMYAEKEIVYNPVVAAELGFSKKVKTTEDTSYELSTEVVAGGEYSYQLRFANGDNATANNVVMFDVLEVAQASQTNRWSGTFAGIDVSQIQAKGIDVKVYYSTASFANLSQSNFMNLQNTDLWTTDEPDDLASVTAIAVDCSMTEDGNVYNFSAREVALAYVYMTAPEDVDDFVDNELTSEDETSYAYNSGYIQKTVTSGGTTEQVTEECPHTTVSLRKPDVTIAKSSDPITGTKESPKLLADQDTLNYNLTITNAERIHHVSDIVVEDTIPEGLIIDIDDITYTYKGMTYAVPTSDVIEVAQDGQKLTFTIATLDTNSFGVITIPTTVNDPMHTGLWLENIATLKTVGDNTYDKDSETTYHKTNVDVEILKKWDDRNNFFNTRPQSIEVQLYGDEALLNGKTATLTEENEWKYTFEDLNAFRADGTRIAYTATEINVPSGYTESNQQTMITNTATFEETNVVTLYIQKYQEDTTIPVADVTFTLNNNADENDVLEATTDENGIAVFTLHPDTSLDQVKYTLREISAPNGYIVTDDTWTVTVTKDGLPSVTLDENSIYQVEWKWNVSIDASDASVDSTLTVYNDYKPSPVSVELSVEKQIEGDSRSTSQEADFTFMLNDINGLIEQITIHDEGYAKFQTLTFEEEGTYSYTVQELKGDVSGYSYDSSVYTLDITVSDINGNLQATYQVNGEETDTINVVFTNTYEKPVVPDTDEKIDPKPITPDTSDSSQLLIWMFLQISTLFILFILLKNRKNLGN